MKSAIEQEYYTQEELIVKLGIQNNPSRISTFKQKTYRREIPGAVKILGCWAYRIFDIEKALINGNL